MLVHAQPAQSPTNSQLQQIVSLETLLFTAQSNDNLAEASTREARVGPIFLALQPFYPAINSGLKFNPNAFTLYPKWASVGGANSAARQSIARREMLFNNRPIAFPRGLSHYRIFSPKGRRLDPGKLLQTRYDGTSGLTPNIVG